MQNMLIKIINNLGKNNDATYAVIAIAIAKGIFRPIFTMMDKKEDYETKKYAAIREGLTECIAIPSYFVFPLIGRKLVDMLPNTTKAKSEACFQKSLKKLCKDLTPLQVKNAKKTMSFLTVCITALVLIPTICSAAIKPIIRHWDPQIKNKKSLTEDNENTLNIDSKANVSAPLPYIIDGKPLTPFKNQVSFKKLHYSNPYSNNNYSLRIGGGS